LWDEFHRFPGSFSVFFSDTGILSLGLLPLKEVDWGRYDNKILGVLVIGRLISGFSVHPSEKNPKIYH
jgi:hypothetical protein